MVISVNDAIRIYKNSKMFSDVLLIDILDLEVTKEANVDKMVKLYHDDQLVGINVFDEQLASQFNDGFNYPDKKNLDIINDYLTDTKFSYAKDEFLRVGEIKSFEGVKGSDKLNICEVVVGDETYSIVCGAANVYVGMKSIVALDNALLPTGVKISSGPVFGVDSDGMLCSKRELGFKQSDDEKGIVDLNKDEEVGLSFFDVDWGKYNV